MFTRIMIFGKPGSGKSTFALKLHEHVKFVEVNGDGDLKWCLSCLIGYK